MLSMTTGWPQDSESFCPTSLARMSGALPGGAGTTIRTDFSGNALGCATACAATPSARTANAATFILVFIFMLPPLL